MTHAAKVDQVQAGIVGALRRCGAQVESLAGVGKGVPDLLVGYAGNLYLLEVKSPGGKLTTMQKVWHRCWQDYPVYVVHDTVEALNAIGASIEHSSINGVDH